MELKISVEELKKAKIFVATPMYGGQCAGMFTKSTNDLAMLVTKYGVELGFYYLFNESLITRARNYCVDEFLRSDFTHMVFIDSDIGFSPNDVLALIALQMQDPDNIDVITGPYPKKSISWEKIAKAVKLGHADENPFNLERFVGDYVFNPAGDIKEFRVDRPVEVLEAGTGFMCIPRKTFEKYAEAYPEYHYLPDHIRTESFDGSREIMAYFDCIIDSESKRYLSEDYMFCQNVRKAGMKVWMCPWMELKHMGSYIFGGGLGAMAAIQASPTASNESNQKYYKEGNKPSYIQQERLKNEKKKAARAARKKRK
jgi:hypothetical protein